MLSRIKHKITSHMAHQDLLRHEHTAEYGGVRLKYLLYRNPASDKMAVAFSGMNPQRAVYNYVKTLQDMACNRLYILDDFGADGLGCYYVGTDGRNEVEQAVFSLLREVQEQYGIQKMIFCGSSKGGYASLNFGLEFPDAAIICGAPQYFLGYYLTHRKSPSLLHTVMGETYTAQALEELDNKVRKRLAENAETFHGKIYLHYSDQEHTYPEHIAHLLQDLKENHYSVSEDCRDYTQHDDVSKFFPAYLHETMKEVLGKAES